MAAVMERMATATSMQITALINALNSYNCRCNGENDCPLGEDEQHCYDPDWSNNNDQDNTEETDYGMSGGIIALIIVVVVVGIAIVMCRVYAKNAGSSSSLPGAGRANGGPVITGSPIPASTYSVNMQPVQPSPQTGMSYPPGAGYNNAAFTQPVDPSLSSGPVPSAPPPSYNEALSAPYPTNAPDSEQAATKRQISDNSLPSYDTFTNNSSTNM